MRSVLNSPIGLPEQINILSLINHVDGAVLTGTQPEKFFPLNNGLNPLERSSDISSLLLNKNRIPKSDNKKILDKCVIKKECQANTNRGRVYPMNLTIIK